MPSFFLSDSDVSLLRWALGILRGLRINTPGGNVEIQPQFAPEVYVAKPVASGGLAALSSNTPGSGDCDIYKINSSGDLEDAGFNQSTVYNVRSTVVAQEYILVARTKYGHWVAICVNG